MDRMKANGGGATGGGTGSGDSRMDHIPAASVRTLAETVGISNLAEEVAKVRDGMV